MPSEVRSVIEGRHVFYEVSPYYVVADDPSREDARMIKAGFDVDVFGAKASGEPQASIDYELLCSTLEEARTKVAAHATNECCLETIPYESTVYFDPKHGFGEETLLRIGSVTG